MKHQTYRLIFLLGVIINSGTGCVREDPCATTDLRVDLITVDVSDCLNETGKIEVAASGGTAPYRYELNVGLENGTGSFNRVGAGDHIVRVKDANDCEETLVVKVSSNVSFQDVRTIVRSSCARSACHDGSRNIPNFNMEENIRSFSFEIQSRTGDRSMPPPNAAPPLTDDQIQLIDCWVRDGAL